MFAKFIADVEAEAAHVFGEIFPKGKFVKVDHLPDAQQAALAANPTFETKGDVPEAAPVPAAPAT